MEIGRLGRIKVAQEIYEEIIFRRPSKDKEDLLVEWLKENSEILMLGKEAVVALVGCVTEQGYARDLTDVAIEETRRDPFLVAYALVDIQDRAVVTTEHSRPKKQRANRKLPDVCIDFNVGCINTFTLIQELDFHTGRRVRS